MMGQAGRETHNNNNNNNKPSVTIVFLTPTLRKSKSAMANYVNENNPMPPRPTGKRIVNSRASEHENWNFLKADANTPAAPTERKQGPVNGSTSSWEQQNAWKHKRSIEDIQPHAERVANLNAAQARNAACSELRTQRLHEVNEYNAFNPTTCDEAPGAAGHNRNNAHKTGVLQGNSRPLGHRVEEYLQAPQPTLGGRVYRPGHETDAQWDRAEFGMETRTRSDKRVDGIVKEGTTQPNRITAKDNLTYCL